MCILFTLATILLPHAQAVGTSCRDMLAPPRQISMYIPEPKVESILDHEYDESLEGLRGRLQESEIPPVFNKILSGLEARESYMELAVLETLERIKSDVSHDFKSRLIAINPAEAGAHRHDSPYFRLKHWDWEFLHDYFSTKPSRMIFTRLRDLTYLRFVVTVAESMQGPPDYSDNADFALYSPYPDRSDFPPYSPYPPARQKNLSTMQQVATLADHLWHLWHLRTIMPKEAKKYEQWQNRAPSLHLALEYVRNARAWASAARDPIERNNRENFIRYSVEFRESNALSTFDLYIVEKYSAIVRQLDAAISTETIPVDMTTSLTHWNALKDGLARGSLDYLEAFLDHNSHDTAHKAYLLRVLAEMSRLLESDPEHFRSLAKERRFHDLYEKAFQNIDTETMEISAPPQAQTDQHLFTVIGQRAEELTNLPMPKGTIVNPFVVHLKVTWNSKLGKLESNVVKSIPLTDVNTTVLEAIPELKPFVTHYFNRLRRQKDTWTEEQVDTNEERELNALLLRSTFILAMERDNFSVEHLVAMSRIFYGGPRAILIPTQASGGFFGQIKKFTGTMGRFFSNNRSPYMESTFQRPVIVGHSKTFVELDFPDLQLPERKSNEPLWELGRLLTTAKAVAGSRYGLVRFMSDYFLNMGERGTAYLDGGDGGRELYKKMGAEDFENPTPIQIPKNYKQVWILKATLRLMKNHFGGDNYDAIRLREKRQPDH